MKKNLKQLFLTGAASFLLGGCCTTHHVTQWEYKVVRQNAQESLMNDLAKDGWIFVSQSDQTLCFKRPKNYLESAHHVTALEYKVVRQNRVGVAYADFAKTQESLMNDLARDGWIFVSQSDETLCFMRPVR